MADKQPSQTPGQIPVQTAKAQAAARKKARLSEALKANMARRKGQARARASQTGANETTGTAQDAEYKED